MVDPDIYIASCLALLLGEDGCVHFVGSPSDADKVKQSGFGYLLDSRRLVQKPMSFWSVDSTNALYDVIFAKSTNLFAQQTFNLLKPNGIAFDFHKGVELESTGANLLAA